VWKQCKFPQDVVRFEMNEVWMTIMAALAGLRPCVKGGYSSLSIFTLACEGQSLSQNRKGYIRQYESSTGILGCPKCKVYRDRGRSMFSFLP
jgi:hypothetical protein